MKDIMKAALFVLGLAGLIALGLYVVKSVKTEYQSIKQEVRSEYEQVKGDVVKAKKAEATADMVKDFAGQAMGGGKGLPGGFGQ